MQVIVLTFMHNFVVLFTIVTIVSVDAKLASYYRSLVNIMLGMEEK